jgi:hypothetical protein
MVREKSSPEQHINYSESALRSQGRYNQQQLINTTIHLLQIQQEPILCAC